MSKTELIFEIQSLNKSASPTFLADFNEKELEAYLAHLKFARTPRPSKMLWSRVPESEYSSGRWTAK